MEKKMLNHKFDVYKLPQKEAEFFENDVWDLKKRINYELTNYQKKSLGENGKLEMDFNKIANTYIKSEFKHYWFDKIHNKHWKETNMIIYRSVFNELCDFINTSLNNDSSIVTRSKDTITFMLKNHLINKGKNIEVKRGYRLNKQNEKIQRTTNIREIKTLIEFYDFVFHLYNREEGSLMEKDIWTTMDIQLTKEQIGASTKTKSVNFETIKQDNIKLQTKEYMLKAKNVIRLGTLIGHLNTIKKLSQFLYEEFPSIQNIFDLKREHIESFFGFIETQEMKSSTKKNMKIKLKTIFERMEEFQVINFNEELFYDEDFQYKIRAKPPKIIPNIVLEQLNNILDEEDVPVTLARMILIIQHIGCRISELCTLGFNSVSRDSEGDYHLTYYQIKTSKWIKIPIEEGIAILVLKQEKETKEKYPNSEYLFINNHGNVFTSENFSISLNELAYKYNIKDENKNIYRFKSHAFRKTKASTLMNLGVSPQIIAKVLGHAGMSSLKHYAKMNDENIISAIKIIDEFQKKITDISFEYQELPPNEAVKIDYSRFIPLPNGFCGSKEECKTAYACYSCPFFKPHSHFLPQYEKQLLLAKQSLQVAKINKLQRQIDMNEQLIKKIEKVIHKVKK